MKIILRFFDTIKKLHPKIRTHHIEELFVALPACERQVAWMVRAEALGFHLDG